uniref:NADH-ubiquinone oxidoreductase chain 2 n=1 Tax=Elaeidobius kamerunicus TaxID=2663966 RepID=A0A7D5UD62_9CUCU|nr:NADH dehydrogenase subunit 2 [Elaeidobius kamerunicus]QLI52329.1 NADH dehydrogenase subunit 2 [Elaeidobius kamerunicus]
MLFFNTMILGTLISISSMSWLTAWIGLEINLLSLMPLMKSHNNSNSAEAAMKYFIIQAMASAMLLFSVIIFTNSKTNSIEVSTISSILISSAILLKLGAAPFHFWFPEVMSGMDWKMAYILMTWQKIAPMILLTYTTMVPMFLSVIIIFSSMISGLQGLNQTCLRKILAYSSINHVSWMISALLVSTTTWMYYFITYCIINLNIILIFKKFNIFFISQLSKLFNFNKKLKFFFMLNFLSLGGLPPFLGFFPKWLTVNQMIFNKFYTLMMMLIIFTLIILYMYMRLTFSSFTMNTEESLTKMFKINSFIQFFINFSSLMSLIIVIVSTKFI